MGVDLQQLVAAGYRVCPGCHGLNRPNRTACTFCNVPLTAPTPAPTTPARRKASRPPAAVGNTQAKRGVLAGLGSFTEYHAVELVVPGLPVSEGSANAVATGVIAHSDSKRLHAWRQAITDEAKRVCGTDWIAANCPLKIGVVLTIPLPAGAPDTKPIPADGWRDLDKLLRAVGDGLSPKSGWRLLVSDMRISSHSLPPAKTHPRPLHTHPCALDDTGAWIRVEPDLTPPEPICLPDGRWVVQSVLPDPNRPLVSRLIPR